VVAVDPLASLAPRSVLITLAGRDYVIAARPAIDWLEVLISSDFNQIVPGWLDEDSEDTILDQLMTGDLSPDELKEVILDTISVAAGRPWWWALRLIRYASDDVHHWSRINGRLILAGVRVKKVSLSAWVDAVYAVHCEGMDEEQYTKLKADMDMPPSLEYFDEEAEAQNFLSMMG